MRRLLFPVLMSCALIALCAGVATSAPAQNATGELEGKLDELESNIDQQGGLQATIDSQNAQINDLIAQESELRRRATAVQGELDRRQAELDEANATRRAWLRSRA